MHIRKQVYDLTAEDFRLYPLWEFCSDEEGLAGQDEATVKPSDDHGVPAYSPGAYVVATDFVFADGSAMEGYIYSGKPEDFGCITPIVFLKEERISFWFGRRPPSSQEIAAIYKLLDRNASEIFPIRFRTRVPINGDLMDGSLNGFGIRMSESGQHLFT